MKMRRNTHRTRLHSTTTITVELRAARKIFVNEYMSARARLYECVSVLIEKKKSIYKQRSEGEMREKRITNCYNCVLFM